MKGLPDLTGITLRDLKDLERELGRPIGTVLSGMASGDMSGVDADVLAGLVWLRLRRDEPALTLDAVWDMDLSAFEDFAGEDDDEKKGLTASRTSTPSTG